MMGSVLMLGCNSDRFYASRGLGTIGADGDSITRPDAGWFGTCVARLAEIGIVFPASKNSAADASIISSEPVAGLPESLRMRSRAPSALDPFATPGARNLLIGFGGTNDLYFGADGDATIAETEAYFAERAPAWGEEDMFYGQMLPRVVDPTVQEWWDAEAAKIRAWAEGFFPSERIIPFHTLPNILPRTLDGVHPGVELHQDMGLMAASVLYPSFFPPRT